MVERMGVSLDGELLRRFDRHIKAKGYTQRSEAIRDLIRGCLIEEEWENEEETGLGVALMVYDHHDLDLPQRLMDVQHDHHESIVSCVHVHVDHDHCLEILILRGPRGEIRRLAEKLISVTGVKHGIFLPTTTGSGM